MKKIIYTSLLLLSVATLTFAQKDTKAKDLLDKSSAAFNQSGGLSVSFTLNIKDVPNNVTESFDGSIALKENKFYISTPEMDTWFDGKTQWVYMKGPEEVNVSEPDANQVQALNPASILEMYKKGCNYKYLGEKTDIKMRKVQEVELIPQNKKAEMTRIVLQINSTDFMPVMFHIYYKNKIENVIYIQKYQVKQNHPDSMFQFDTKKYPKVEVIDLR